ncbi:MAG: hypothetical protein HYT70_00815 [Candidatus Aenigmarchaeota archaeon]|nr:hypothetical protein [Candidatus Aenigmarchaeota archaeon]
MYRIVKIKPAFIDERGTISDILEEPVSHIGIIASKAGAVRGKHYHKKSAQYIYIVSGKMQSFTKELDGGAVVKSHILVPGDLEIVPQMIIHAHKALEDTVFLTFSTETRDSGKYEEDTFRTEIDLEQPI